MRSDVEGRPQRCTDSRQKFFSVLSFVLLKEVRHATRQTHRHLDSRLYRRSGERRKPRASRTTRAPLCGSEGVGSCRGVPPGRHVRENCKGVSRNQTHACRHCARAHHGTHLLETRATRAQYQGTLGVCRYLPGTRRRPNIARRIHRHFLTRRPPLLHHDRGNGPMGARGNRLPRCRLCSHTRAVGQVPWRAAAVWISVG